MVLGNMFRRIIRKIIKGDQLLQLEFEKDELLKGLEEIAKSLPDEERKLIEDDIEEFNRRWKEIKGGPVNWRVQQKRELLEELSRKVSYLDYYKSQIEEREETFSKLPPSPPPHDEEYEKAYYKFECPLCKEKFVSRNDVELHLFERHSLTKSQIDKVLSRRYSFIKKFKKAYYPRKRKIEDAYNWLIERRSRAPEYAFRVLPAVICAFISFIVFHIFIKNIFLLAGSLLFSASLLFSKEGSYGYLRALLIFLSILILWLGIQGFHKLLGLIFLFIGYAMLSPRITSEEYHGYETTIIVFRFILGLFIALSPFPVFFNWTFDLLALALTLIGLGFFALAFPEREEGAGGGVSNVSNKVIKVMVEIVKGERGNALAVISGLLVLLGVIFGIAELFQSFGFPSSQLIFFGIIGFAAVITAFSVKGHHRGEAGFPLYLLLLFTVTTSYPDILGEAVFGPWWPQISATLQTVAEPISTSISQLQQGMSDIWLMFTCPSCYYEEQLRKQQSASKAEGSIYSVEVTEFKLFSNQLDPAQPLTGIITFENRGESDAKDFKVEVLKPKIYIKTSSRKYEYADVDVDVSITCTGKANGNICEKNPLYKTEKLQVSFSYGSTSSSGSESSSPWSVSVYNDKGEVIGQIDECRCVREDGKNFDCGGGLDNCKKDACLGEISINADLTDGECVCDENTLSEYGITESDKCSPNIYPDPASGIDLCICECNLTCRDEDHLVYKFGGYTVKIGFNYSFEYSTNVSLQITAMKEDLFNKLMKEGKIVQKEVISSYTGGPVRASIWTQVEPVIYGKKIFMSYTITNDGTGKILKGTKFGIKFPDDMSVSEEQIQIGQQIRASCETNKNGYDILCTVSKDIEKGNYARVTFWVKINELNYDQKTLTFVGYVNYIYGNEIWKTIQIVPAPFT